MASTTDTAGSVPSGESLTESWEMPGPDKFDEFNPNNPYTALALLGERVTNLGKEKEALERDLDKERTDRGDLEKRVAVMEKSFQRGAGVLMVVPMLGTVITLFFIYGEKIFAPWLGKH